MIRASGRTARVSAWVVECPADPCQATGNCPVPTAETAQRLLDLSGPRQLEPAMASESNPLTQQAAPATDLPGAPAGEAALLLRISNRDREAFARFFEQHQSRAYNLALRITRQAAGAEEALQEAMLRVWKHAAQFKPEGSSRSWLLRIVARESIRWLRQDALRRSPAPLAEEETQATTNCEPSQLATQAEMVERLRGILDGLPALEQQILALYYASGLTQEEVGQALEIPQRTVSKKLSRLLERFREQLRGGPRFSPALLEIWLADLLTSGSPPPPGTGQALQAALDSAASGISRRSPRPGLRPARLGGRGWPLWGALAFLAGGLFLVLQPFAPATAPGGQGAPQSGPLGEADRAVLASGASLQPQRWSFEDGDLRTQLPRAGDWVWAQSGHTGRKILFPKDGAAPLILLLPVQFPAAPFEIELLAKGVDLQNGHDLQAGWRAGRQVLPVTDWSPQRRVRLEIHRLYPYRFTFHGRYVLGSVEGPQIIDQESRALVGLRESLFEYEKAYPAAEVALILRNCALAEISIRPLDPREEAQAAQRIESFLQRKDLRPVQLRGGSVEE